MPQHASVENNTVGNNAAINPAPPQYQPMVYAASPPPPPPAAPPRPQKQSRVVPIVLVSTFFCVAIIVGIFIWQPWTLLSGRAQPLPRLSQAQIDELEKKYGYDLSYTPDIASTEALNFDVSYDYGSCASSTCQDAWTLYSDAALTRKIDMRASSSSQTSQSQAKFKVTINPPATQNAIGRAEKDTDTTVTLTNDARWGVAETYFLVQRLDENGAKLSRPKVTLFTIKPDSKMLAPTDASVIVDNYGSVNFTWSAVDGAKDYYVIKVVRREEDNFKPRYELVAKTSETSVNTSEYNGDKTRAEQAAQSVSADQLSDQQYNFNQNEQFTDIYTETEDSFYNPSNTNKTTLSGSYVPTEHGLSATSFAVVAVRNTSYSAMREVDGNAILAQTPVALAAYQGVRSSTSTTAGFDSLEQSRFVTMADGHTAQRAVQFDAASAKVSDRFDNSDVATLPYRVQGSLLASWDMVTSAKGSLTQSVLSTKLSETNARNLAAQPPIGATSLPYSVKVVSDNLKLDIPQTEEQQIPKEMPSVPYPVNGTSDIVKFIAANIMAGNYTMNIEKYYTDPTITISEAFSEAMYQNPYADIADDYIGDISLNGTILTINMSGISKEDLMKRQQLLLDQTKTVVSQVTNSSMTDRQKALALNQWLIDYASYDHDALQAYENSTTVQERLDVFKKFQFAWNGLGTAVYTKGVCESYAEAFKALADLAGIKAIYVSGTDNVSGGGHAWNKVFIDGKWQVVDVTWNDAPNATTEYFGITDKQANRVQDDDFITKRFINDYAAN